MKEKVVKHVNGKDGVVREVIILHKGNYLERPIQLVCPLEIRSVVKEDKKNHNASTKENVGGCSVLLDVLFNERLPCYLHTLADPRFHAVIRVSPLNHVTG